MKRIVVIDVHKECADHTYFAGYENEHLATKLSFDVPIGFIGDGYTYEIAFENSEGMFFANASSAPVEFLLPQGLMKKGVLVCQLTILVGKQAVYKTSKIPLKIFASLKPSKEVSDKYQGLIDDAIARFNASQIAIKNLPQISEAGFWQLYNLEAGRYEETTVYARGNKGDKGDRGNIGEAGRGISEINIDTLGRLRVTYSDGTTANVGTVSIRYMGEYQGTVAYGRLCVVTYNGSSYITKIADDNTEINGIPPTDIDNWSLLAEKGDDYVLSDADRMYITDQCVLNAKPPLEEYVDTLVGNINSVLESRLGGA